MKIDLNIKKKNPQNPRPSNIFDSYQYSAANKGF